jgi:hypothetical protein
VERYVYIRSGAVGLRGAAGAGVPAAPPGDLTSDLTSAFLWIPAGQQACTVIRWSRIPTYLLGRLLFRLLGRLLRRLQEYVHIISYYIMFIIYDNIY